MKLTIKNIFSKIQWKKNVSTLRRKDLFVAVHWRELTISVLSAIFLWYGVSGSEKLESQIEVRLDYRGIPADLVVRKGLVSKVVVRVRAPAGLLRTMYGREYTYALNLTSLAEGENAVAIPTKKLPFQKGVEVIDAHPPYLDLLVDRLLAKELPVQLQVEGDIGKDYTVERTVQPTNVLIKGAASVVDVVDSIFVIVAASESMTEGTKYLEKVVIIPEGAESVPSSVTIMTKTTIKRREVSYKIPVKVYTANGTQLETKEEKVEIIAQVPVSKETDTIAKNSIAKITLPSGRITKQLLPVGVELPKDCIFISVNPVGIVVPDEILSE